MKNAHIFKIKLVLIVAALSGCGGGGSDATSTTPDITNPPQSTSVPSAPQNLSATPGNGTATINFSAPNTSGSSPITSYTAQCTGGGITKSATNTSSPISIPGLTNGTSYSCTVLATNSFGNSPNSNAATTTPVAPQTVNELTNLYGTLVFNYTSLAGTAYQDKAVFTPANLSTDGKSLTSTIYGTSATDVRPFSCQLSGASIEQSQYGGKYFCLSRYSSGSVELFIFNRNGNTLSGYYNFCPSSFTTDQCVLDYAIRPDSTLTGTWNASQIAIKSISVESTTLTNLENLKTQTLDKKWKTPSSEIDTNALLGGANTITEALKIIQEKSPQQ